MQTSILSSTPNFKIPVEQSKARNKSHKKSFRDLMSDSLSQSNASSIHESSDLSSITSFDDSMSENTRGDSPSHLGSFCYPLDELRKKYKREFKDAIRKNYKYMMSENIMDSCKMIENEFSAFDSDELSSENNAISYNEFVRQYQELITWLTTMHDNMNQNQINCCNSEKYLNQAHHEELLHRLTRRSQFQEYSSQLIDHYPSKKDDIITMCNHVDQLWMDLEKDVEPGRSENPLVVIKDIEQDLQNFENWIINAEKEMNKLRVNFESLVQEGAQQFIMNLQREIQSKSKFVTSILQMCENLLANNAKRSTTIASNVNCPAIQLKLGSSILEDRVNGAKNKAMTLQHRWEAVYINCLEWQLRFEGNVKIPKLGQYSAEDSDDTTEGHMDDTAGSDNGLSIIEEEKEDIQSDDAFLNVETNTHIKINHQLTHDGDVGYSSDGQKSPDLLLHANKLSDPSYQGISKVVNMKVKECNGGSDLSDSSGVAISATTGSFKSKSDTATNSDQLISGSIASSGSSIGKLSRKAFAHYDNSIPATEDEFSNDEIKNNAASNFSKSMDLLTHRGRGFKNSLKDESVSDGEILNGINGSINKYHMLESNGSWNKHKTRLHLNEDFSKEVLTTPFRKTSPRKKVLNLSTSQKLPKKRSFNSDRVLTLSDGCLDRKFKSEKSSHFKVRKVMSFEGLNIDFRCYEDGEDDDEQLVTPKKLEVNLDQCVPDDDIVSNTADEMSSLQSEVESTDVEDISYKSNVDMWLEDNVFDRGFYKTNKHSSTPKGHQTRFAPKQLPFCDYITESDSEAEDFKVTLDDIQKALAFTERAVQDEACSWFSSASSQQMPDLNKLIEALATCETSLKCLQDLKAALMQKNSSGYYDHQINVIEGLLGKWISLKANIHQHQQQACNLIHSETLKVQEDLNKSLQSLQRMNEKDDDHDVDQVMDGADAAGPDAALQALIEIIKDYKAEKDNLFALKERVDHLMKINPWARSKKRWFNNVCVARDVFDRIVMLNNLCSKHLTSATNTIMSLISTIEPCHKFTELKKVVTSSLEQSDSCLKEVSHGNIGNALVELLSSEMKGSWIALDDKISQMHQLNVSLHKDAPAKVQRLVSNDLDRVNGRYKDLQLQSSIIIERLISNKSLGLDTASHDDDKCKEEPVALVSSTEECACDVVPATSTTDGRSSSGMARLMKNILKVGVPLSAAMLFLGWMYNYSNAFTCSNDWSLVIFPNLRYTDGQPPM